MGADFAQLQACDVGVQQRLRLLEVQRTSGKGCLAKRPWHEEESVSTCLWSANEGGTSRCGRRIPNKEMNSCARRGVGDARSSGCHRQRRRALPTQGGLIDRQSNEMRVRTWPAPLLPTASTMMHRRAEKANMAMLRVKKGVRVRGYERVVSSDAPDKLHSLVRNCRRFGRVPVAAVFNAQKHTQICLMLGQETRTLRMRAAARRGEGMRG